MVVFDEFSDKKALFRLNNWTITKHWCKILSILFVSRLLNFTMAKLLLLNGPNLNLLGTREPEVYGTETLDDIITKLNTTAQSLGHTLESFQSNAEHSLVDKIQTAMTNKTDFIIINPAAFTHTSVAIRDALAAVDIPFIEVHLSNIHSREPFRHHSYLSDLAFGVICGLGSQGYELALQAAIKHSH